MYFQKFKYFSSLLMTNKISPLWRLFQNFSYFSSNNSRRIKMVWKSGLEEKNLKLCSFSEIIYTLKIKILCVKILERAFLHLFYSKILERALSFAYLVSKVHINLGAGESEMASARGLTLNDETWHEVNLTRREANITLQIDVIHTTRSILPGRFFELNIHYGVYIGGQGDFNELFLGKVVWLIMMSRIFSNTILKQL